MELVSAFDPYVVLGLSMGAMLTICLVILFFMRDPYAVPPHAVSRTVWCAGRQRRARVDFVEWVETGMNGRSIRQCSIRGADRCDGACSRQQA